MPKPWNAIWLRRERYAKIKAIDGRGSVICNRVVDVISGPAAAAKVEFINWFGFRFTDFFVLYKHDGQSAVKSMTLIQRTKPRQNLIGNFDVEGPIRMIGIRYARCTLEQ